METENSRFNVRPAPVIDLDVVDEQDVEEPTRRQKDEEDVREWAINVYGFDLSQKVEMCWAKTTCDQGGQDDRNHHQIGNYSIVYGWLPLPKTVIGAHLFF